MAPPDENAASYSAFILATASMCLHDVIDLSCCSVAVRQTETGMGHEKNKAAASMLLFASKGHDSSVLGKRKKRDVPCQDPENPEGMSGSPASVWTKRSSHHVAWPPCLMLAPINSCLGFALGDWSSWGAWNGDSGYYRLCRKAGDWPRYFVL